MHLRFLASVSIITSQPARDDDLCTRILGMPLGAPTSVVGSRYLFSEEVEGAKHFGVWPLDEAAQACFGSPDWPSDRPVPQACLEFEVDDVDEAAAEVEAAGYDLIHGPRTEPWGQQLARFQSGDGLLLAVCRTPHLRGS